MAQVRTGSCAKSLSRARALAASAGDGAVKTKKKKNAMRQTQALNGKAIMKKLRIGTMLPS